MALWDTGDATGMRGLAQELGLRYVGTPSDRTYEEEIGELPKLGILATADHERVRDLMFGRYGGLNLQVFGVDLTAYPDDKSFPTRSCVLITFAARFPRIAIGPHSRMTLLAANRRRGWLVDFTPDAFRAKWYVEAPDSETAELLFGRGMASWLMAGRDDVRIAIEGGSLLVHVPQIAIDDPRWRELVTFAVDYQRQIPDEAWMRFSPFGSA